jgi:2-polyprenyl-6-methoxyphenol hydroxylase-like FAD-dependent oxidoreductase
MSSPTHKPVLIVGAGVGGLVLAQRLKAASVPFRLFERDLDSSSRAQGWSLSLSWILPAINTKLGHLQHSVYAHAVNAELGGCGALAVIDGYTGESLMRIPHEVNSDGTQTRVQANRSKLRGWLAQGLDIEWNKRYESHATLPDGVRVTFTDGTSATGSCLVGADGVHSGVRHNLFATADPPKLVTAPVNYVIGTRILAIHDYEQLMGLYASEGGAHIAAMGTNKRLVISLCTVKPDLSEAALIWYLSYLPSPDDPEPGEEQTREGLLAKAVELTRDLVEPLRELVSGTTDLDEVSQVVVRSIITPYIPNGLVTLLGDAAHATTPCMSPSPRSVTIVCIEAAN